MFETFHTPERLPAQNLHVSNFHRSLFGPKLPARSDQHVRGVVTKEMKGKSSTSMTACSFDHITVCSFMPLLGEPLPPGVICPFKKVNTHWQECWQSARFYAHDSGSQTPHSFTDMLLHCYLKPMRVRWPDLQQRLVLGMDSGGGSLLHLTVETAVVCDRYACDVFLIPSYCTKAMCALDQQPHARMSLQWSSFKRQFALQQGELGVIPALRALKLIVTEALSSKHSAAGWAHVGLVPGEPINRNKVLLDRFDECFQSKRSGAKLEEKPESKGSAVLDLVSKVAPKKEKCSNPDCRKAFAVTYKHCPSCGAENSHFDAQELMLSGPGKKSGWVKGSLHMLSTRKHVLFSFICDIF